MSNQVARGGTELMQRRVNTLPLELLSKCQIIHSRVKEPLDPDKKKILVLHDLPLDPMNDHLKNGGWQKFDHLVFVSHWQQDQFHAYLGIPYHIGTVIHNAIDPFTDYYKTGTGINLIYFSTPHRGLIILDYVFKNIIVPMYSDVQLNVFSSFDLYGWGSRDSEYKELFDNLEKNPYVNYSKSVSNEEIRKTLETMDILAFPSIWQETSCLVLIESLCAGLRCVHPNYAALTETSMGLTDSYQYTDDMDAHVVTFAKKLIEVIDDVKSIKMANHKKSLLNKHVDIFNEHYNIDHMKQQFINLIES